MLFAFSHALRTVAFPHACVAPASLAASLISQFFHTFYGESFRTIDPVTTLLRNLVEYGPLLSLSRA